RSDRAAPCGRQRDASPPDEASVCERLPTSGGGSMGIVDGFGDLEFRPEQRRDSWRRVPFHRQAAALRRSIECKRRDDCGAAGLQGASKVSNVHVALLSGGKEM